MNALSSITVQRACSISSNIISKSYSAAPSFLGLERVALLHSGQPFPCSAQSMTFACQKCSGMLLQRHQALKLLPRVISSGDLSFLSATLSFAKSGLPSDSRGCSLFPLLSSAHLGQPVLLTNLCWQEAMYGSWPSGQTHRHFKPLALATSVAGVLLGCHSADSLSLAATDWQWQKR